MIHHRVLSAVGPFLNRQKSCCIAQLHFSRSLRNIKEWLKTSLLLWSLWWSLVVQQHLSNINNWCWQLLHQIHRQKDFTEFPFSSAVPLDWILDPFDKGFDSLHLMEVLVCFVFFAFQYFPQQTLAFEQIFSESKSDESWFLLFILYVTFDNWPYIWWIIKWWIILSHVEPFYPVSGTKYRNPNISKKVLLLHVLKLPCYIHWQLLKYIPQSNIFVIDFLCKDKTIINIEYIE